MRILKFKKKYGEMISSGRKRMTIRIEANFKPGEIVTLEVGGERIGEAVIREVEEVSVEELSDEIAREDGFESLRELLEELRSIYGDEALRERKRLKLIRFEKL